MPYDEDAHLNEEAQRALLESYIMLRNDMRRRKAEEAKAAKHETLLAELREFHLENANLWFWICINYTC